MEFLNDISSGLTIGFLISLVLFLGECQRREGEDKNTHEMTFDFDDSVNRRG